MAVVVFPTPPFWFAIAIIRATATSLASDELFHVKQTTTFSYRTSTFHVNKPELKTTLWLLLFHVKQQKDRRAKFIRARTKKINHKTRRERRKK